MAEQNMEPLNKPKVSLEKLIRLLNATQKLIANNHEPIAHSF